jgi:hypothetical protein
MVAVGVFAKTGPDRFGSHRDGRLGVLDPRARAAIRCRNTARGIHEKVVVHLRFSPTHPAGVPMHQCGGMGCGAHPGGTEPSLHRQ